MIDKIKVKYYTLFREHSGSAELPEKINEIIDWIETQQDNSNTSNDTPANKARRILQAQKDKELCIKANICFICGENLVTKETKSDVITKCPIDDNHYYNIYYHRDVDYD